MKQNKHILLIILIFSLMTVMSSASLSYAQNEENQEKPAANTENLKNTSLVDTLNTLIAGRQDIIEQIKLKKHERKNAISQEDKDNLSKEITALNNKLQSIEKDIQSLVFGMDMEAVFKKEKKKFVWKDELFKLVTPIVQMLEKITERPRKIQKLRTEIENYKEQLAAMKKALKNLDSFLKKLNETDKRLKNELIKMEEVWQKKVDQHEDHLTVANVKLNELLKEKKSFFESSQEVMKSFFKSRGRNFILAILAFISVFLILRYCHRLIYKYSPIYKAEKRNVYMRLVDVIYHILTILCSTGALFFILYISADWVLLSFAIIFVLALAWTAKEGIPLYWKQIQLMLNLGSVKEGERITYLGVPWRVISLNLYTTLENPSLTTKTIRVPLKEMLGLNSRPVAENEGWFPAKLGEWVILSDGTRGEVITQTPEVVELKLRGGSIKVYSTQDYLSMNPVNISVDFRIKVLFGLDYNLQEVITTKIPEQLTEALKSGLKKMGHKEAIKNLKVEIDSAGASSIDLVIIADFSGKAAPLYNAIKRAIQKLTIEACTENNWSIPYPQIVVHSAEQAG